MKYKIRIFFLINKLLSFKMMEMYYNDPTIGYFKTDEFCF